MDIYDIEEDRETVMQQPVPIGCAWLILANVVLWAVIALWLIYRD